MGDGLCLLQHAGQHGRVHVGAGQAHADALAAQAVALLQRGGEGGGAGAFGDVVGVVVEGAHGVGRLVVDTPEKRAALEKEVMKKVDESLGAIARPARVHFINGLPKTRSGKMLRRSIQALAEGRDAGDLTTIDDPSTLEQIKVALKG